MDKYFQDVLFTRKLQAIADNARELGAVGFQAFYIDAEEEDVVYSQDGEVVAAFIE